ncbi:hypothetical protein K4L44_04385 [Halosquirtibacter laminarini]|uniref:Uncharacterized protein n=1 Tax=Halosquirtibacter laminarini TaxID=3374600 RepID=A0AC61NQ27_9BACT|nr:hypothetical protein K4L44_04385 [Prolixibacteraceae bacterium]
MHEYLEALELGRFFFLDQLKGDLIMLFNHELLDCPIPVNEPWTTSNDTPSTINSNLIKLTQPIAILTATLIIAPLHPSHRRIIANFMQWEKETWSKHENKMYAILELNDKTTELYKSFCEIFQRKETSFLESPYAPLIPLAYNEMISFNTLYAIDFSSSQDQHLLDITENMLKSLEHLYFTKALIKSQKPIINPTLSVPFTLTSSIYINYLDEIYEHLNDMRWIIKQHTDFFDLFTGIYPKQNILWHGTQSDLKSLFFELKDLKIITPTTKKYWETLSQIFVGKDNTHFCPQYIARASHSKHRNKIHIWCLSIKKRMKQ